MSVPELPEVETIRRGLERYIVGKTIEDVEVRLEKQISGNPRHVIGTRIIAVRRFGKGLVVDLDNDYSIAIHVKMTGQLIFRVSPAFAKASTTAKALADRSAGKRVSGLSGVSNASKVDVSSLPDKYTHVVFKLKSKNEKQKPNFSYLFYRDIRQFGWIKIVQSSKLKVQSFFRNLGPEPLRDLTLVKFSDILSKSKMPIKLLIMDQEKIAGVGNIYANDALFVAKIDPKRRASALSSEETKNLFEALEKVLKKGIEAGGASEWNYVNALGEAGEYQNFFQVYGMKGKDCLNCKTKIERIVLGGRGTFFCPACQS